VAGAAKAGMTAEEIEYQKMMGKDPGAVKSTGFPPPLEVGKAIVGHLADPFFDNGPNDKGIGIQLAHSLGRVALGFFLAVLVALVICAVLLLITGKDPIEAYSTLFGAAPVVHAQTEQAAPRLLHLFLVGHQHVAIFHRAGQGGELAAGAAGGDRSLSMAFALALAAWLKERSASETMHPYKSASRARASSAARRSSP
jgi:hypothetical protein